MRLKDVCPHVVRWFRKSRSYASLGVQTERKAQSSSDLSKLQKSSLFTLSLRRQCAWGRNAEGQGSTIKEERKKVFQGSYWKNSRASGLGSGDRLGGALELLPGRAVFHARVSGFGFHPLRTHLPANVYPIRQQVVAQVPGSLAPGGRFGVHFECLPSAPAHTHNPAWWVDLETTKICLLFTSLTLTFLLSLCLLNKMKMNDFSRLLGLKEHFLRVWMLNSYFIQAHFSIQKECVN